MSFADLGPLFDVCAGPRVLMKALSLEITVGELFSVPRLTLKGLNYSFTFLFELLKYLRSN